MGPEQDSGVPMERSRRNPSVSGEPDARQETEPQRQPVQQDDDENTASQLSPRRCDSTQQALQTVSGPSPTSTPGPSSTYLSSILLPPRMPLDPPITKHTLSELDLTKIVHNWKLRHDINFNPELHFRPNIEGGKNRRKQERSDSFWRTLRDQLTLFVVDRDAFAAQYGDGDGWCLPVLLKTAKEILETLVPHRDRQILDEGLNVPFLMMQFYRGVLDLDKLAEWLSGVLKSHCAPMRDDEVEIMVALIKTGNQESDLGKLVLGLRELLNVLEHMKLDVANHQIRCWRPILIQDTVHFEQRFLCRKVESGRMTIDESRQWYADAKCRYSSLPARGFGDMSVLFEALMRLVQPSSAGATIPETLQNDHERLTKLRMDILDAVNLDICMRLYDDLERVSRYNPSARLDGCASDDDGSRASSRTPSSDFNVRGSTVSSRPSSLVLSCAGSDTSSPRSSLAVPAYVESDQAEARGKAHALYCSLVDLLYTAAPAADQVERWRAVAPSMAVQIFRYTNAPSGMLAVFEEKLMASLSQVDSQYYRDAEQAFHQRLMEQLSTRVRDFKGLTGLGLFTAVSERRLRPGSQNPRDFYEYLRDGQDEGAIDDIATRLAHLGILHWRVWAGLAYDQQ